MSTYESIVAFASLCGLFMLGLALNYFFLSLQKPHLISKLKQSKCPNCNEMMGAEAAVHASQTYWDAFKYKRNHGQSTVNLKWTIKCPNCNHENYFDPRKEKLYSLTTKSEN